MNKRSSPIFVTIKSRLYLGFFLLVLLFIVNGIITLVVLQKNKNLSNHISTIIDPATNSLIELNQVVIESKMLSSNWVFVRSNKEDKDALLKIHSDRYPQLRQRLNVLTPQLFNKATNDSLQKIYADFNKLIVVQKGIIATLNSFESYDNAFVKMEMELIVEGEIILELKASNGGLPPVFMAQLLTYLKLSNRKLGYLIKQCDMSIEISNYH